MHVLFFPWFERVPVLFLEFWTLASMPAGVSLQRRFRFGFGFGFVVSSAAVLEDLDRAMGGAPGIFAGLSGDSTRLFPHCLLQNFYIKQTTCIGQSSRAVPLPYRRR